MSSRASDDFSMSMNASNWEKVLKSISERSQEQEEAIKAGKKYLEEQSNEISSYAETQIKRFVQDVRTYYKVYDRFGKCVYNNASSLSKLTYFRMEYEQIGEYAAQKNWEDLRNFIVIDIKEKIKEMNQEVLAGQRIREALQNPDVILRQLSPAQKELLKRMQAGNNS